MLKAILFDLGDTLLDFQPFGIRATFEQAGRCAYDFLVARGHVLPDRDRFVRKHYRDVQLAFLWSLLRRRDFNGYDILRRSCEKLRLSLDEPTLRELAWAWYHPLTTCSSVCEDVLPVLARLRARGLKLGIISNTYIPGFVLDRHMDLHGLLEFFPTRVYSSEVGYRKPDRRIFDIALNTMGLRPADAVFVGNTIRSDILGARRVGLVTVLRKPSAASRTHPIADHVVRSITELYQILPLLGSHRAADLPPFEELACET